MFGHCGLLTCCAAAAAAKLLRCLLLSKRTVSVHVAGHCPGSQLLVLYCGWFVFPTRHGHHHHRHKMLLFLRCMLLFVSLVCVIEFRCDVAQGFSLSCSMRSYHRRRGPERNRQLHSFVAVFPCAPLMMIVRCCKTYIFTTPSYVHMLFCRVATRVVYCIFYCVRVRTSICSDWSVAFFAMLIGWLSCTPMRCCEQ